VPHLTLTFCCRREYSWLRRLFVETCATGFDQQRGVTAGFTFTYDSSKQHLKQVALDSLGPQLLVSDCSTEERSLLRWRVAVRGNTAVEFGVVPVDLQVRCPLHNACVLLLQARQQHLRVGPYCAHGPLQHLLCALKLASSIIRPAACIPLIPCCAHGTTSCTWLAYHTPSLWSPLPLRTTYPSLGSPATPRLSTPWHTAALHSLPPILHPHTRLAPPPQDNAKALHKCQVMDSEVPPYGMCSNITVGSQLFFKCPLMKGSVVEVMADRERLVYIVHNPHKGKELQWHNTRTVPRPYRWGPSCCCKPVCDASRALRCCWVWAASQRRAPAAGCTPCLPPARAPGAGQP
jgi:hypothetical protein